MAGTVLSAQGAFDNTKFSHFTGAHANETKCFYDDYALPQAAKPAYAVLPQSTKYHE